MEQIRQGVYPTMITPYAPNGEIDYALVERLVDWYAEKGCRGVFSVCQSSEMAFLSLRERVRLAQTVTTAASGRLDVVASGHISDSPEAQAEEVCAVAETGVRAVVLVTNRLDPQRDGDGEWIRRAETLLSRIPPEVKLGLYECPNPYKRLLTPEILDWCLASGRFSFIKDTCCDPDLLTARLRRLAGCGRVRGAIRALWPIFTPSCWFGCASTGRTSRRPPSGCRIFSVCTPLRSSSPIPAPQNTGSVWRDCRWSCPPAAATRRS